MEKLRALASVVLCVGIVAASAPAVADDFLAAGESLTALDAPGAAWRATPGVRHYGVMADAGVPEGTQLALVVRPVRMLRLHGGLGYNGVSTGVQGGVTFVPFGSWFTPTLSADIGTFPDGDATSLVRMVDPSASSPVLRRVGYHYENARLGFEFGRRRATFYVHAGLSRVSGVVHDTTAAFTPDPSVMVTATNPRIDAWSVSARIGLIVYFGP